MFGSTERVHRLRERLVSTVPRLDAERAVLVSKAHQETEGEPSITRRAKTLQRADEDRFSEQVWEGQGH